jgi:hypothetical protein
MNRRKTLQTNEKEADWYKESLKSSMADELTKERAKITSIKASIEVSDILLINPKLVEKNFKDSIIAKR